jgi:outer membrane lipoprotein-sorting protein
MKIKIIGFCTLMILGAVFGFTAYAQNEDTGKTSEVLTEETAKASLELDLEGVILKLQENYKEVNSYQATFKQELKSLGQDRVISKGEGVIFYKKPSKMIWKYSVPEEHLYLTVGDTIWDYSPAEKEVYILQVGETLYKSFLLGLGELEKDFEISFHSGRKLDKKGRYQLDLVPKSQTERETLGIMTLYVDPKSFLVQSTEMVDVLGNKNTIVFESMQLNIDLPDKMFVFEVTKDMKVIEATEMVPVKP